MNYLCDYSDMAYDIYHDPQYALGASFFAGILFSPLSWGIVFYFLFLFIWSLAYWVYCKYTDSVWILAEQVGLFAASLFGFLLGRTIIEEDDYQDDIKYFKMNGKWWCEELDLAEWKKDTHDYWENKEKDRLKSNKDRRQRLRKKGYTFHKLHSDSII